jgi:hypothetical protein
MQSSGMGENEIKTVKLNRNQVFIYIKGSNITYLDRKKYDKNADYLENEEDIFVAGVLEMYGAGNGEDDEHVWKPPERAGLDNSDPLVAIK